MSTAAHLPRRRIWLRVLVLLLALLVPGGPAEVSAAASVVAGETVDYDAVDTAVRPTPGDRRAAAPLRPAPRPAPAPCAPAARPRPAAPGTPYAPHTLRTVVLRC
ncbi:hypothetical protein [Streptomyces sp. DSM 15324]|uniref:hypothetical protein n=1 Tax=Streptomyces sp. DSM 15324 TaxID=1739111 RepID=UPI0007497A77|nr:hypothetical protein [Streptomyces sp. DSM 15324]KUO08762.1 hypothetical protein AQJ58_29360 [Streptomyces sp. DSM 15324]